MAEAVSGEERERLLTKLSQARAERSRAWANILRLALKHATHSDDDPHLREFETNELAASKLEEGLHSGVSAREAFQAGDKTWLLFEIWNCNRHGRKIPGWATEALDQAYGDALAGDLSSWDDVFGKPFPQGKQRRRRKAFIRKWEVWAMVCDLAEEGNAIDDHLFERVGRKLAVGARTKVKELYAECEKQIEGGKFGPTCTIDELLKGSATEFES